MLNNKLLEKLKQVELDLAANKRWSSCSQVLNWPNTHHKQGKKDLGCGMNIPFILLIENMWDYLKILFVFIVEKRGHYRHACSSRKYAIERNLIYVKQIWVRKDEICMSNGKGPKWI